MSRTYVYAIIAAPGGAIFETDGVDGAGQVETIALGRIAAVVSGSALSDYRGLSRSEAVRYLVAHQRVVEVVMRDFAVLPVKFGTVLESRDQTRRLLALGGPLLQETLRRFAGKTQAEVVVLWNLQQVFAEIGREETIGGLMAQVADRPQEATVAERIAIGRLVHASMERRRAALRERLLKPLHEVALDLVMNAAMDDNMVLNAAVLVDAERRVALERTLELLDREFEGRFLIRCVGPLPPYSFATVEIEAPTLDTIDGARRCLGLGEAATLSEIRQAYRRLATVVHPDHNQADPAAETHMADLTRAYSILSRFAEGQARMSKRGPRTPYRINHRPGEKALLIQVRRQEAQPLQTVA